MNKAEWIKIEDKSPPDDTLFVATDGEGWFGVITRDVFHGLAGKEGIYTPTKFGQGARVRYWLPLPNVPGFEDD